MVRTRLSIYRSEARGSDGVAGVGGYIHNHINIYIETHTHIPSVYFLVMAVLILFIAGMGW